MSGSDAELHCSIAAAVWSGLPSESNALMLATVRGKMNGNKTHVSKSQRALKSTPLSVYSGNSVYLNLRESVLPLKYVYIYFVPFIFILSKKYH